MSEHDTSAEAVWYRDGLRFTCTQCGKCCTGEPGYVLVSEDEITQLAASRGLPRHEFIGLFTRRYRSGHTLREKVNGDCVFYDSTKGCTVYQHRPMQCRTWPFWESNLDTPEDWQRTVVDCPGAGEGELIPVEEILRRVRAIKM
jgi:hypothetical protein